MGFVLTFPAITCLFPTLSLPLYFFFLFPFFWICSRGWGRGGGQICFRLETQCNRQVASDCNVAEAAAQRRYKLRGRVFPRVKKVARVVFRVALETDDALLCQRRTIVGCGTRSTYCDAPARTVGFGAERRNSQELKPKRFLLLQAKLSRAHFFKVLQFVDRKESRVLFGSMSLGRSGAAGIGSTTKCTCFFCSIISLVRFPRIYYLFRFFFTLLN